MKKMTLIATLILSAAFIAPSAYAMYSGIAGSGQCPVYSANARDRQAFYDNTVDLRADLSANRAEREAILAGDNPNPEKVRALTQKMSKQQDELRAQAEKYNVTLMGYAMGYGNDNFIQSGKRFKLHNRQHNHHNHGVTTHNHMTKTW